MRILGYLTHAWPTQRGGSETSAHELLRWLAAQGHEVRCLVVRHKAHQTDGVLYAQRSLRGQNEWWQWCDVAISQQGSTTNACRFGLRFSKPVAHWAHNWHYLDGHLHEMNPDRDLIAWNSEALERAQGDLWSGRSTVLHPPTFAERWKPSEGTSVTQVNLSKLKGGELFWDLARRMPDLDFYGVGGWGEQVHGSAPNAMTIGTTTDMASVYARTGVLIIPTGPVSERQVGESWGKVAAEASACGIPIVAAPSPGLREQLGTSAYWCDPAKPSEWVTAIRKALSEEHEPCPVLDPTPELEAFEDHLVEMVAA